MLDGLTLDFGGNIFGHGTIDTPDDPATPMINNGNIMGLNPVLAVTLAGYVKGVGTCDNCIITGTDAPGFSTAAINRGSVSYNGTLEIEIGGLSPGSDFDQLNHILGSGIADLGGVLDVELTGGFTPSAGDSFDIITASLVQNIFDTELLPSLTADLTWIVDYQIDGVSLLVGLSGDFDFDGDVDGFDFLQWQWGESPNPLSAEDLAGWEVNYGTVAPLIATSATVPEPAIGIILLIGMVTILIGHRTVVS